MGSSPVISTPSLGHEHVPEVCRIHSAIRRRADHDMVALTLPWSDLVSRWSDLGTPPGGGAGGTWLPPGAAPRRAAAQRPADCPRRVFQSVMPNLSRLHLFVLHPAVTLVRIKRDILCHARRLSSSKNLFHRQPTPTAGVALSYFHPERSEESFSFRSG